VTAGDGGEALAVGDVGFSGGDGCGARDRGVRLAAEDRDRRDWLDEELMTFDLHVVVVQ